jgi:hypothetical protein
LSSTNIHNSTTAALKIAFRTDLRHRTCNRLQPAPVGLIAPSVWRALDIFDMARYTIIYWKDIAAQEKVIDEIGEISAVREYVHVSELVDHDGVRRDVKATASIYSNCALV